MANADFTEDELLILGRHGSGHSFGTVRQGVAALIICNVLILILVTLYFFLRIYYKKKYFSADWIKKNGPSLYSLKEP